MSFFAAGRDIVVVVKDVEEDEEDGADGIGYI